MRPSDDPWWYVWEAAPSSCVFTRQERDTSMLRVGTVTATPRPTRQESLRVIVLSGAATCFALVYFLLILADAMPLPLRVILLLPWILSALTAPCALACSISDYFRAEA